MNELDVGTYFVQLWSPIVVLFRLFIQLNKHQVLKDAKTKKRKKYSCFDMIVTI